MSSISKGWIEGFAGLEYAEGDMNEFTHGGGDDRHVVFAFGLESQAQGTHQRVVSHRSQHREVEQLAKQTVALLGKAGFAVHGRARVAHARGESDKGGGLTSTIKAREVELPDEPGAGGR